MKCPHCGSTAQVKALGVPVLSDNKMVLTEHFDCGCGCWFYTDYERNADGAWEWCFTGIHAVYTEEVAR